MRYSARLVCVACLCLILFFSVGCQKPKPRTSGSPLGSHVYVDPLKGSLACEERCNQDDELSKMTRKGCLRGCELAKENMPLRNRYFYSVPICMKAVKSVRAEEAIAHQVALCKKESNHLYKRKGCANGVESFYSVWDTKWCAVEQKAKE